MLEVRENTMNYGKINLKFLIPYNAFCGKRHGVQSAEVSGILECKPFELSLSRRPPVGRTKPCA